MAGLTIALYRAERYQEIIDLVAPIQNDLRRKLGTVFAFLGDEFYIRAGRKVPPKSHYRIVRGSAAEDGEYPQIEDGVGMTRHALEDLARLGFRVGRAGTQQTLCVCQCGGDRARSL